MKAVIIEDEAGAANHLERLIRKTAPDIVITHKFETVRDSVTYLSETNHLPDLIFADIQLADGISFEIFKTVAIHCPIIFTTAWDHYAIEAFKTNGIDYLLKPVEEERLRQAIDKVKLFNPLIELDKLLAISRNRTINEYKSRFLVKAGDKIRSIPADEVTAFYSLEKATYLHTASNRNYAIEYSLDHLERLLDPYKFFRINRRYIVAFSACNHISAWSNSRLKIKVEGLDENELIVARERIQEFRAWLDQ